MKTAEQVLHAQDITVSEIVGLLGGDLAPQRVRHALMLAYNRGYTSALDATEPQERASADA